MTHMQEISDRTAGLQLGGKHNQDSHKVSKAVETDHSLFPCIAVTPMVHVCVPVLSHCVKNFHKSIS